MNKKTTITMIRHAESLLNEASHNFRTKNNVPYVWEVLSQHD